MAYGWLGAVGPLYGLYGRGIESREEVLNDRVVALSEGARDSVGWWAAAAESVLLGGSDVEEDG